MDMLKLEIVTPDGSIHNGKVSEVTLPGSEGEFTVLPKHASLLSLLDAGVVDFVNEDSKKISVMIHSGHVKVNEEKVTVLVEGAVAIAGDTESDVAEALAAAKEILSDASDASMALAAVESRIESAAKRVLG